uniref:cell division cycle-associated protein 4-like n=1 Tax=Doryrhamphus excisus TaxID=161450 RepID=UPI0025AE969D|nr:cell division cycle-associated protein 4-like [Doryrhamphus excisus]
MLGCGVKRKWRSVEELASKADTAAEEKEVAVGCPRNMSRLQQRQRVLGLCLEKLQRYQAGMELSLRRSVLLVNTLRQIQDDMQSDMAESPGGLLNGVHPDLPRLRDALREDMSFTCHGCAEGGEERPSPALSHDFSPQEMNVELKPPISTFSDVVNAVGYLSDLTLDDIFEDIDTSMYETSDLSASWTVSSLWPISVSFWGDEDVKMRSGGHASAGTLQSCLMDLNELDHIMEILVKS